MLLLSATAIIVAQTPAAPPAKPPTCDSTEHRQFDFWVGEWDVTTPDGRPAGHNSITLALGDCVVHEHWTGAGGLKGESFNTWDRVRRRWHQTWVSARGDLLLLDGGFSDGAMRMSGESGPAGRPVMNRITWTPSADGLRQLWETSTDGGKTWQTSFDGRYKRRK